MLSLHKYIVIKLAKMIERGGGGGLRDEVLFKDIVRSVIEIL